VTEREVSSERVSEERLERLIMTHAPHHSTYPSSVSCGDIVSMAQELLALRSSVKTVGTWGALREAAEAVCRKLESETASVTIFDQEALRSALSAIGSPSEGEAYYWVAERPNCIMHPKLFRSEAQANNWAASITVRPPATVRPLYAHPTPQEAPSEVTDEQVERAMKSFALIAHDMTPEAYDEDRAEAAKRPITQKRVQKSLDAMRAALISALKGDRS
jgi:hypothetical protein